MRLPHTEHGSCAASARAGSALAAWAGSTEGTGGGGAGTGTGMKPGGLIGAPDGWLGTATLSRPDAGPNENAGASGRDRLPDRSESVPVIGPPPADGRTEPISAARAGASPGAVGPTCVG